MILSMWKPVTNYINNKQIIIRYDLIDINNFKKKGTTGYKILWKCDNDLCNYKERIHSINAGHLYNYYNKSKNCNEKKQICKSCQSSGENNINYGAKSFTNNTIKKLKKTIKKSQKTIFKKYGVDNISKIDFVKIKKRQSIITKEYLTNLVEKTDFILLDCIINGKNSKLKIKCKYGHIISNVNYIYFRKKNINYTCKKCFYESLKISRDYKINFEEYKKEVYYYTTLNYRKYKNIINPNNLKRGKKKNHLDHKYSICEGFKNKIEPKIIGNVINLELINYFDNLSKNKKCSITKKQLLEKYTEWENICLN